MFSFKVNSKQKNTLPLMNDLSFLYNGNFVTHRQAYEPVNNDDTHKFFNISSYGNGKLFNYLRKTFQRQNIM